MNSIKRNKRELYLCKKYIDPETNVTKYKKPIKILINWQPISTDSEVLGLGIEYSKHIRIKCTNEEAKPFDHKDRVYIYTKLPKEFDEMCNDADYEVETKPLSTINQTEIMLQKLGGADE